MATTSVLPCILILAALISHTNAEVPAQFFDWRISYSELSPLPASSSKKVIVINKQFPGPDLVTTTNNLVSLNVHNDLDEPFLITWNGIQQRHNSWEDGTMGTNCPIPPGSNWTYVIQFKDQIGSFFYYPSMLFQKSAGGYGGITIINRNASGIQTPFDQTPAAEFTILIGDWYIKNHKDLRANLDNGELLPPQPDGVIINGHQSLDTPFIVKPGLTYRLRISNVGIQTTLNFRIQSHQLLLVETEGSYVQQTFYDSLDVHVGQSYSVLVTADQNPGSFYVVASTRFIEPVITAQAILQYEGSTSLPNGPIPAGPDPMDYDFSLNQAQSIRWNLTAGAARPNRQGSYMYGSIPIVRTLHVSNTPHTLMSGAARFGVNNLMFLNPDTPLKLADYFNISGVFTLLDSFPFGRSTNEPTFGTAVIGTGYKENNTEIIFQNNEDTLQVWHLDGYSFFVVGMGHRLWTTASRSSYNNRDAISRSTIEVYPKSWTAVLLQLDNKGMWNLRSQQLQRQYLGQEIYVRVWNNGDAPEDEAPIPSNVILCGQAANLNL